MKVLEAKGKSVEQAIASGLDQMDLSIEDVSIEIVDEGSKGLFGLIGSRPAVVRLTERDFEAELEAEQRAKAAAAKAAREPKPAAPAKPAPARPSAPQSADKPQVKLHTDEPAAKGHLPNRPATKTAQPKASLPQPSKAGDRPAPQPSKAGDRPAPRPAKAAAPAKPAPRPERAPREEGAPLELPPFAETQGELEDRAKAFLGKLLGLMEVEGQVLAQLDDGNMNIRVDGDNMGILIGYRGETLNALQYLTGLVVNRDGNQYVRVSLDTENYRARREETLERLARKMAMKVRRTGQRVVLEPMNPFERRVLHAALQSNPFVTTHSEGEEPNRRVVITPKRAGGDKPAPKAEGK